MVHDIKIKLRHDCPFLELTHHFDGIAYGYCIRSYDVLSIPGHLDNDLKKIAKESFPNFDTWKISEAQNKVSYIQMGCLCDSLYDISITGEIQRRGGLIRYPISYQDGWETYSITGFDAKVSADILAVLDEIREKEGYEIEIISNRDVGLSGLFQSQLISGPELFSDLTPKQLDTLILAIDEGYYQMPRQVRTQDIAEQLGRQRYSVDKLIRAAENKIIKNLTPYLYFKQYLDSRPNLEQESQG